MKSEGLAFVVFFSLALGFVLTRYIIRRRYQRQTARRLLAWADNQQRQVDLVRLPDKEVSGLPDQLKRLAPLQGVERWLLLVGLPERTRLFWLIVGFLLFMPLVLSLIWPVNFYFALITGAILALVLPLVLYLKANRIRMRFVEQLPNAIDLMASVLRSGHSVPQAVKTVSDELPEPCGAEFKEVLQRMNVGQPLAQALSYSAVKFRSYELDLIRRAIAIQAEIGGSLADLIDKTNQTLKGRLKLASHVKTLTAQSRLSALIVGILPLALAVVLDFINPGYLNPLIKTEFGKTLLTVAIALEVVGVIIMKRLSGVKV